MTGLIEAVSTGGTPPTSEEDYWGGTVPWLTPKDLSGNKLSIYVSDTERTLTSSGLRACASGLLLPGTVLLTKRAPVGLVAVNTVGMAINQGFLAFRCGHLLRPLYLAYWLRVNRPYLDQVANGSTYPELYLSDLFEFQISVPSMQDQDKILEIVAALQFANSLTIPLEQASPNLEGLAEIHQFRARISSLTDEILPALFSGLLSVETLVSILPRANERAAA